MDDFKGADADDLRARFTLPGQGTIQGTTLTAASTETVHRFTGVPYALPPRGSRRWRKPEALPASYQYDADGRKYTQFALPGYQPDAMYDIPYGPRLPPLEHMTEDVLYVNIWRPARELPDDLRQRGRGWPIVFYIHGGWLQCGAAYNDAKSGFEDLITHGEGAGWDCIVVAPAYRLSVFGFLASEAEEGARGNFGFWDQRAALEWTAANAAHFGGDASNITISGLSAGAQSVHAQLLHEYSRSQIDASYRPLIRRCLIRSGSAIVPSKSIAETRTQMEELCGILGVDSSEGLDGLRRISPSDLTAAIPRMKAHTFRSVKDGGPARGGFVGDDWCKASLTGDVSRWARQHGIMLVIGECADEDQLYRLVNAPKPSTPGADGSLPAAAKIQLGNYYPARTLDHLLPAYEASRPAATSTDLEPWADYYGRVTSDAQVFAAQRLLLDTLLQDTHKGLTTDDVLVYRLERRAAVLGDLGYPASMGVFHASDELLFRYPLRVLRAASNATEREKDLECFKQFLQPLALWIRGTADQKQVARQWYDGSDTGSSRNSRRILRNNGTFDVSPDPLSDSKAAAVEALRRAVLDDSASDPRDR